MSKKKNFFHIEISSCVLSLFEMSLCFLTLFIFGAIPYVICRIETRFPGSSLRYMFYLFYLLYYCKSFSFIIFIFQFSILCIVRYVTNGKCIVHEPTKRHSSWQRKEKKKKKVGSSLGIGHRRAGKTFHNIRNVEQR